MTDKKQAIVDERPRDKYRIVYYVFILHGIGTLMSWNMFINAKPYFVDFKFSETYTHQSTHYADYFMTALTLASQLPNLILNWTNVFVKSSGNSVAKRISWSICVLSAIFILTIVLAIADTSAMPGEFFCITMVSIVVLNMANGVYQSCLYGLAARLPSQYTGAVVLGNNISGTLTSVLSIICDSLLAGNYRTGAIYYFTGVLVILSFCFDSYIALPLNKFYRYYDTLSEKVSEKDTVRDPARTVSIRAVLIACREQLFNVFITFCVTLAIFPTVYSDIKRSNDNFFIADDTMFMNVTCFLTFNTLAMVGSFLPQLFIWPKPSKLIYLTTARVLFIPLMLLCNYQPANVTRTLPILIANDWIYWAAGAFMSLSHGYLSSLSMMYVPSNVDAASTTTAGMLGGAFLATGIFTGVLLGGFGRVIVSSEIFL